LSSHDAISLPAPRKRHWLWPTRLRVYVGLVIALAIWGWLDVRRRGEFEPSRWWEHKTDFTVYTEAGAAFFDGRDPYQVTNPRGWGYLYPPLFAIVVSPLHDLAPENQVTIWFVISVLCAWASYRELMRIAACVLPADTPRGMFGTVPIWLMVLAATTAMLPALNCLQRGQVGLAKLYFLLLGYRLLIERKGMVRPVLGGIALVLAVTLKITPIVPAAIAVLQTIVASYFTRSPANWRLPLSASAGTLAGLALWLLVVPALAIGWQANLAQLQNWWGKVALHSENISEDDFAGNATTLRNQSLTNAAYRFGNWAHHQFAGGPLEDGPAQLRQGGPGLLMDAPVVHALLRAVRGLAGLLLLAVCFKTARAQDRVGQAAAFGLACAATLVLFTIARGHYYVLMFPAVAFTSLWLRRERGLAWAIIAAIVPCLLVIGHYAFLSTAGRAGMLGLGTTIWYFTIGVALLWPSRAAISPGSMPRGLRQSPTALEREKARPIDRQVVGARG